MLAARKIPQYQYIQKHKKIQASPESCEHTELRRRNLISLAAQAIQEYRYFEQNKNSQCSEYSYDIKMKTSMSTPQPNLQFSNHEQNKTPQVIQESHTYTTFPKISPMSLAAQANQEIRYGKINVATQRNNHPYNTQNITPLPGEVQINQKNQNIMVKSPHYQPSRERPNQTWIASQNQITHYPNRNICNPSISSTGATIHNNHEIIYYPTSSTGATIHNYHENPMSSHPKDFITLPQPLMEGSKLMKQSTHIIQSPEMIIVGPMHTTT